MNSGGSIYNQIVNAVRSVADNTIVNKKMAQTLSGMTHAYKDTITARILTALNNYEMILVVLPIDRRFPANIPFIRTKRQGKDCVIVDISKYATVTRDEGTGDITVATCDVTKLYNLTVPAYLALKVLNKETVLSSETIKWLSLMWARMFNKVLMAQKIFVGNTERYEAFYYFAMRFFMIYYLQIPLPLVDRISLSYINNVKSKYILQVEERLRTKDIELYKDWNTFASLMFSNEVTNIRMETGAELNAEYYIKLFASSMGRDGAYMALWSVDYFFYCLFVSYNKAFILNDRNWEDIVLKDAKAMPKLITSLFQEL
jgi:hypothetical protein